MAQAELLAVHYVRARRIEGKLVSADPDKFETERLGKTPVHWVVVFEQTHHGKAFDGPGAYRLNLATGEIRMGIQVLDGAIFSTLREKNVIAPKEASKSETSMPIPSRPSDDRS